MANQSLDEINGRDCFYNVFIILMLIVMKGNGFTVIVINS